MRSSEGGLKNSKRKMLISICGSVGATPGSVTDNCLQISEVQKLLFQRTYSSGTTKNSFTIATANPNLAATWATPLAASDSTKVVAPPFLIDSPTFEPGDVYEDGGPGETSGGIPKFLGHGPGKFSFQISNKAAKTILEMRQLYGETLSVYFINIFGKIIGETDDNTTPTIFRGVPIKELKVGGRQGDSINSRGFNQCDFYLNDQWDNYLHEVTPSDFNALTDLGN